MQAWQASQADVFTPVKNDVIEQSYQRFCRCMTEQN